MTRAMRLRLHVAEVEAVDVPADKTLEATSFENSTVDQTGSAIIVEAASCRFIGGCGAAAGMTGRCRVYIGRRRNSSAPPRNGLAIIRSGSW